MTARPRIKTVVLIDDNRVDHILCRRIVERSGLVENFVSFVSAEEALSALKSGKVEVPDAILLDVNMPRMNGFEFLEEATRELGKDFARMVVMMLTTSLNPADMERAMGYSIVKKYCNKPLVLKHLEELAEMLDASRETGSAV